jgi:hypothetical protein
MPNKYEAPELTLIGQADEVILGSGGMGFDAPFESAPDFEFEHDGL